MSDSSPHFVSVDNVLGCIHLALLLYVCLLLFVCCMFPSVSFLKRLLSSSCSECCFLLNGLLS